MQLPQKRPMEDETWTHVTDLSMSTAASALLELAQKEHLRVIQIRKNQINQDKRTDIQRLLSVTPGGLFATDRMLTFLYFDEVKEVVERQFKTTNKLTKWEVMLQQQKHWWQDLGIPDELLKIEFLHTYMSHRYYWLNRANKQLMQKHTNMIKLVLSKKAVITENEDKMRETHPALMLALDLIPNGLQTCLWFCAGHIFQIDYHLGLTPRILALPGITDVLNMYRSCLLMS